MKYTLDCQFAINQTSERSDRYVRSRLATISDWCIWNASVETESESSKRIFVIMKDVDDYDSLSNEYLKVKKRLKKFFNDLKIDTIRILYNRLE